MPFEGDLNINSNNNYNNNSRLLYNGIVVSIEDNNDGGRIKVRILGIDNDINDNNLPWSYPLLPRFFYVYPKKGESVRILLEDINYTHKGRYWIGNIISQTQNIKLDTYYTSLSTSNISNFNPEPSLNLLENSKYVLPNKEDIGVIGRDNSDILLKENEIIIRVGRHEYNDIYKFNNLNPAQINLNFNKDNSNIILMADKIGIITHSGIPNYKHVNLNNEDKNEIFNKSHPIPRGDVLLEILETYRKVIINHVHGYSNLPADNDSLIKELENMNIELMLNKNIVIN